MTRKLLLLVFVAVMGLFTAPTRAQDVPLLDILAGKTAPLTLKYQELMPEWRQFTLATDGNPMLDLMLHASPGMMSPPQQQYYTKGETITSGGVLFLLAYRRADVSNDLLKAMAGGGRNEDGNNAAITAMTNALTMTKDTPLSLCLLNVKTIGNILNIRPLDATADVEATAKLLVDAHERAQKNSSLNNLRQLVIAYQMYAQDHDQEMPKVTPTTDYVQLLQIDKQVALHPKTHEPYRVNLALSGKKLTNLANTPDLIPVFYEASAWSDGSRQVSYLDGHVASLTAEEWARLQAKWKLQ